MITEKPQHIIQDVFLSQLDEYNFVLQRKYIIKEGKNAGNEAFQTLGYYPNLDLVAERVGVLAEAEWVNGDFNRCRNYINGAVDNLKKFIKENK